MRAPGPVPCRNQKRPRSTATSLDGSGDASLLEDSEEIDSMRDLFEDSSGQSRGDSRKDKCRKCWCIGSDAELVQKMLAEVEHGGDLGKRLRKSIESWVTVQPDVKRLHK